MHTAGYEIGYTKSEKKLAKGCKGSNRAEKWELQRNRDQEEEKRKKVAT